MTGAKRLLLTQSVIGCYTEHRPFGEPTEGLLGKATPNQNKMTNRTNRPFQSVGNCVLQSLSDVHAKKSVE
jgi:hypothetical protein